MENSTTKLPIIHHMLYLYIIPLTPPPTQHRDTQWPHMSFPRLPWLGRVAPESLTQDSLITK